MAIDIGAWELVRTVVALACFTLVPGYLALTLAFNRTTFERYLTVPISLGLGLAVSVLVSYITEWAGGSLTDYWYVMLTVDIIGTAIFALRHTIGRGIPKSPPKIARTTFLLTLLVLIWFGVTLRNGPRIGYAHDTWQHVAHIREAVERDILTPTNALRPGSELPSFVTRWHTVLAGVARSADVDEVVLWYVSNAYVAALASLVMYAFARMVLGRQDLSLIAAVLFLATTKLVSTFVYPWGISYTLMWVCFILFVGHLRAGGTRYVLVAVIVGITMNFLHGMEFIFLCLGVSAFAFATSLNRKKSHKILVRSLVFFTLLLVSGFPFSVVNYAGRINSQINRMVTVTTPPDALRSLDLYQRSPSKLLYWMFPHHGRLIYFLIDLLPFGAMALPLSIVASRSAKQNERRLLIALTWAPVLVYVLPGFSWVTHVILAEVWSYRLVRLIPASVVLSATIHWGGLDTLTRGNAAPRLGHAIVATVVAASAGFIIVDRFTGRDYHQDPNTLNHTSPLNHYDMYESLNQASAGPAIVLSDPWTSYAVPALTKHNTLLSEHVGVRRDLYEEMHTLLSCPSQSSSSAIASLERNSVDYIVINTMWIDEIFRAFGTGFYSDYTLDFLDRNQKCFDLIYADDVFRVYEYLGCHSSELALKDQTQGMQVNEHTADVRIDHEFINGLSLVGYSIADEASIKPGQDVQVDLYWSATDDRAGTYAVWIELLCDYPGRERFYGKAIRSFREIAENRSYSADAFEWLAIPISASEEHRVIVQSFTMSVPPDMTTDICSLNAYITGKRQEDLGKGILAFAVMEKDHLYKGVDLGQLRINRQ